MPVHLALLALLCLVLVGCPEPESGDDDTIAGDDDDTTAGDDDDTTAGDDDDTTAGDDDDSGLADCLYYRDLDEDGFGDPGEETIGPCDDPPEGYVADDQDCDDQDPAVFPGAEEICDQADQDCDGVVDNDTPCFDDDGDGTSEQDGDCDDTDAEVHPGAPERCNGLDDDCDGILGEEERDDDADGTLACDGDCDDQDPAVFPGAQEVCDLVDQDCDGVVDNHTACFDDDGDGFSELDGDCDDADPVLNPGDVDADGWSSCDGDCDDLDPLFNPWAAELCDSADNDCNAIADDGCESCTATVPGDFAEIQSAIVAAASGDVICVEPGTYDENLDHLGASVSVLGLAGPYATVVQGRSYGSVASFVSDEDAAAKLQGFTLTFGYGRSGTDEGGGVTVSGADPVLRRLVIEANTSDSGRGAGMLIDASAAPQVVEVIVRDNTVVSFYSRGGGIFVEDASPAFTGVWVQGNAIEGDYTYGDGVYIRASSCSWAHSVIADDEMYITNADIEFDDVRIGAPEGRSGIYAEYSTLTGSNVQFTDNYGDGLEILSTEVTLDGFVFSGNGHPIWPGGRALYDHGGSVVVLSNGVFRDNSTGLRGVNTDFALTNVAVVDHDEFGVWMDGGTATFSHCNFRGNAVDFAGVASPIGTDGNIAEDNEFLDASGQNPFAWDFHLALTSPLLDAGDPTILDPDGSPSDIGAYGGPSADSWDLDRDGFDEWWQPGIYDFGLYPGQGWDCDDGDEAVYPGSGC